MDRQDQYHRILAALHEASFDDAVWPAAAALIDEACGTKGNMLVFGDGHAHDDVSIFFSRLCFRGERREAWERDFFERFHHIDERIPRLRKLPDAKLVRAADLYTDAEKKTSPAYNEALPLSDTLNSLNVRLDGADGSRIVFAVADPVGGGDWTSDRLATVTGLLPHLRQFADTRQALANARALGHSLMALLDNTRCGVVQLDLRGRIVAANDRALDILRAGDRLTDRAGYLQAAIAEEHAELQALLARVLPPFGDQGAAGTMTMRRSAGMAQLALHVTPVGERNRDDAPGGVAALLLVHEPDSGARIDPAQVSALLGLTPMEGRVAALLAEGRTVAEVSLALGRSHHTVRWHMKHLFQKLGVTRQAGLALLISSLAGLPVFRR